MTRDRGRAPAASTARSLALAVIVGLVGLVGLAPTAHADASGTAKAHFRQGQAYFQASEYDRAIAEYQLAFDLSQEPSLIFNIALCHDRANRPEPALQSFQRYLVLAPEGSIADEARESIARLTPIVERIAAERDAGRAAQDAKRREEAARRDAAARSAAGQRRQWIARTIMLSGAAIAIGGGVSHTLAWRTRQRVIDAPDADTYAAERDTFRLQRTIAIGAYAAGAVTIATGFILGRTLLRGTDGPEISATLTPGGATLALRWSR